MTSIQIKKRDGTRESLTLEKIHKVVTWACEGITGVSVSEVELKAQLQFYENMTSTEIQETLIRSAAELISEESPNYQYVAARLISFDLRKRVYHSYTPPHVYDIVKRNVELGFYTEGLLDWYDASEWDQINKLIKHNRDDLLTYVGMEQLRSKYLVADKVSGDIYETPQVAFMMIAATIFHSYPKETRLDWVKDLYDALSTFDISLPTPIMAGVRTPDLQMASCCLIDSGDDINSITAAGSAIMKYASNRAGIGINVGRIRAGGSKVGNGSKKHTGIVPFIKYFMASLKSCNQGGIRSASGTANFPIWHYEFENLIALKNNKGTDETRARHLDYCVQVNGFMYKRLINDEDITFFSPHDVPGLYEAFFRDQTEFERLYLIYEQDPTIRKKSLPAMDVFSQIMQERKDTGRIYIMHTDLANIHGAFDEKQVGIYMTNLCTEILQPTAPMEQHMYDGSGMISLCTLGAINWGKVKSPADFERPAKLLVRALNAVLDYQSYLLPAAKNSNDQYRHLGIGVINFAYFLAKNGFKYDGDGVLDFLQPFIEAYSFYTIKASNDMAKEFGPCAGSSHTKYAQGILPPLNYKDGIDDFVEHKLLLDWNTLAKDCATHGIMNATLMALMPAETSAAISNSTNGIEPPLALVSVKASKDGSMKQVVPEINRLKNKYDLRWDQKSPQGYIKICGLFQKFIDQAISANTSYNPEHYPDEEIPMSELIGDVILGYQVGVKNFYYQNTLDLAGEIDVSKAAPAKVEAVVVAEGAIDGDDCESCKI